MEIASITPDLLKKTLRAWRQAQPIPKEWRQLDWLHVHCPGDWVEKEICFYDLLSVQVRQELNRQRQGTNIINGDIAAAIQHDFAAANPELRAWSALYYRYWHPVPLPLEELIQVASLGERQLRRYEDIGLERLADWLRREEMATHQRHHTLRLRRHLPPTDHHQLFGVEPLLNQIRAWAVADEAPFFLSLEGMGGIGKTALAHAAAMHLATQPHWQDILWISARQYQFNPESGQIQTTANAALTFADIVRVLCQQLGHNHLIGLEPALKLERLQPACKTVPYLVIIDNLETVADVDTLIPHLEALAGPTRFLLTSRHTTRRFPFVQTIPLPALSFTDSYALMQSELKRRSSAFSLTPTMMRSIYDLIGGLPLALKLLAAQLGTFPLAELLARLNQASQPDMYTYIYRLTWDRLSQSARRLLVQLHDLSPDGADITALRHFLALTEDELEAGIPELLACCLLEAVGVIENPVYKIHRLTTTFLQTHILHDWDGN